MDKISREPERPWSFKMALIKIVKTNTNKNKPQNINLCPDIRDRLETKYGETIQDISSKVESENSAFYQLKCGWNISIGILAALNFIFYYTFSLSENRNPYHMWLLAALIIYVGLITTVVAILEYFAHDKAEKTWLRFITPIRRLEIVSTSHIQDDGNLAYSLSLLEIKHLLLDWTSRVLMLESDAERVINPEAKTHLSTTASNYCKSISATLIVLEEELGLQTTKRKLFTFVKERGIEPQNFWFDGEVPSVTVTVIPKSVSVAP